MAADPNARARTALAAAPNPGTNAVALTVAQLLGKDTIKARFAEILGAKAPGFISSIINVPNGNRALKECDPQTIVAAAAVAASLDLPIDPNLGFAYIVPYRNHGRAEAQFQTGYKGFVQLALRSGQYRTINVGPVYEGELEPLTPEQRLRGELRFAQTASTTGKTVGYASFFRLLNGAEMWGYITVEQAHEHARKYSKSYARDDSPWKTQFDAMACKTVLKRLLSHYGVLSVQMQTAVLADQSIVREAADGSPEFDWADGAPAVDAEFETRAEPTPAAVAPAEAVGEAGKLRDLLP